MSAESPALFEIIHSLRAMRRLKPDPVPDALVHEILRAAVAAPSGGNRQPWAFIVVKDFEIKSRVQVYYRRALDEVMASAYGSVAPTDGVEADRHRRQFAAVTYLTDHFHEAPVWIVACLDERDEMLARTKDHPIGAPRAKGASDLPGRPEHAVGRTRAGSRRDFDHEACCICGGGRLHLRPSRRGRVLRDRADRLPAGEVSGR